MHRRGGGKCEGFWFPHMESVAAEDVVSPTQRVNPTFLFLPFPPVKKGVGGLVVLFGLSSPLGFILLSSLSLSPHFVSLKKLFTCVLPLAGRGFPFCSAFPYSTAARFFFCFSSLLCRVSRLFAWLPPYRIAFAVKDLFCCSLDNPLVKAHAYYYYYY